MITTVLDVIVLAMLVYYACLGVPETVTAYREKADDRHLYVLVMFGLLYIIARLGTPLAGALLVLVRG